MIKPVGMPFDLPDTAENPAAEFDSGVEFRIEDFEIGYEVEAPENRPPEALRGECAAFFASGGPLAGADFGERSFEERPQQLEMAVAIAGALIAGENLCVEAPTGVGKSFAYLVPLIFRSRYSRRPAVVSTETIHLQEQLIEKDLPLLRQLVGIDFKAALAKGRRNYVCRRRLSLLTGEERDALLPAPSLVLDLERVLRWLERGADGGRDSLDCHIAPEVWDLIACEGGNCLGVKCPFFRNCYYFRARRQWEEADIVVANHALFFTDLAMRCGDGSAGTLLPNYGAVLIDEAHTLENNAAEYLGLHLSRSMVTGMLNRLYNPDSARGLLLRSGAGFMDLRAEVAAARDEAFGFFAPYEKLLADRHETALTVDHDPGFPDRLTPHLLRLGKMLSDLSADEEDAAVRGELSAFSGRCRDCVDGIDQFTHRTRPDAAYYIETERSGVSFHVAPLDVADVLRETLFRQDFPVVLCSATLTVRGRFDYYTGRTGFEGGRTLRLDSPFAPDQARVLVPRTMPDPSGAEFLPALAREIPRFVELTGGKAFVLFTSYQALRYCADALRGDFDRHGWRLLAQGGELSRYQMLREFRSDVDSVLFGTDSFWTGVDVPGEALSNVIVTKLPFAVPGHPLIAARIARIEAQGGSAFSEYSLPEAVLKFRQGVGRLIRSRSDRGYIVVLDRRLISKNYGRAFLDSIPYKLELFDNV